MSRFRHREADQQATREVAVAVDQSTVQSSDIQIRKGYVDRRMDMAVSAGLTAIGAGLIVFSFEIRRGSVPDPIGSGGLPRLVGAFLVACGLVLIVRRLLAWGGSSDHVVDSEGGTADEAGFPASATRSFYLLAAGWVWALLLPRIGYLGATALFGVAALAAQRIRAAKLVVIPLVFAAVTWLLFTRIFGIRFPAGPIEQLLMDYIPRVG